MEVRRQAGQHRRGDELRSVLGVVHAVERPGVDEVAGWLTPNPGGVGPMTRAMLIKNTYEAEVRRRP